MDVESNWIADPAQVLRAMIARVQRAQRNLLLEALLQESDRDEARSIRYQVASQRSVLARHGLQVSAFALLVSNGDLLLHDWRKAVEKWAELLDSVEMQLNNCGDGQHCTKVFNDFLEGFQWLMEQFATVHSFLPKVEQPDSVLYGGFDGNRMSSFGVKGSEAHRNSHGGDGK